MINTEIREGDILVKTTSYSMTFYDFYRVVRETPKQLKLEKLQKESEDYSFTPCVRPTNNVDTRYPEVLTVTKATANRSWSKYNPDKTYQENHLD